MSNPRPGIVYLVGGGPGDPGLITVRGLECIQGAHVVIHDRLVSRSLLRYAPEAEWIDVGKQPDHHPVPQDQINLLLVQKAQEGNVVVRLKGGDPFIFGRGGEEAAVLAENGIPFEIVPGVTSAIAAPAYAGIPITHRDQACSAIIITGHRASGCSEDQSDIWQRAARGADTLVILMGVNNLPQIVEQALNAGREPSTPVAIIQAGSTSAQKTTAGTLATIVELSHEVRPPAVIVIGEVVSYRDVLRWYDLPERKPLLGLKVLNTQPQWRDLPPDSLSSLPLDELSRALLQNGAEPVEFPAFHLAPAPLIDFFRSAHQVTNDPNSRVPFDWILFTSPRTASAFIQGLIRSGADTRCLADTRIAVTGDATRKTLTQQGLSADAKFSSSAELVQSSSQFSGARIFLPLDFASDGSLASTLNSCGIQVETAPVYQLQKSPARPELIEELKKEAPDVAVVFSRQGFSLVLQELSGLGLESILHTAALACPEGDTALAVREAGFKPEIVAHDSSVDTMVEAIIRWRRR